MRIPSFAYIALGLLLSIFAYGYFSYPIADDAEFTLSDGNDSVSVDLGFPSSKSAGEYAFWIVHRLNQNHAKDRSQANYAVDQGSTAYETQSFWG